MNSVLTSSWFYWAVGVALGLPVGLVLLTEWQHSLARKKSFLARPVSLLRNYLLPLGALLLLLIKATEIPTRDTPSQVCCHPVWLRGAGAAAVRSQRDPVPGGARGNVAQTYSRDLRRRRAVPADCRWPGDHLLLHLGGARQRPVHRAGHHLHRHRPDTAELGGPDHLRAAHAIRTALPAGRLDPDIGSPRSCYRSQLARGAYRHRHWIADHPEFGVGGRVVHEPEPPPRDVQDQGPHGVLGR